MMTSGGSSWMGSMMGGPSGMWAMGIGMVISWLAFLAVVGLAVWLVIRYAIRERHAQADPVSILKARLARGEIDDDQFHMLRATLQG